MESENLNPDLIHYILSLIPYKPRTRMKLVSKDWSDMITNIRETTSQATSYGLVVESYSTNYKSNFITVQDHGKEGILLDYTSVDLRLVASCKGLLLYARQLHSGYCEFMVYSPMTKQGVSVPSKRGITSALRMSIVYDEIKKHFKIIFPNTSGFFAGLGTSIFSSETWEWSECMEDPDVPCIFGKGQQYPSFCSDGKMFFAGRGDLKVYDVEKSLFEYVVAPPFVDRLAFAWVSEGKFWSCYYLKDMITICVLQDNGIWKTTNNIPKLKWYIPFDKILNSPFLKKEKVIEYYDAIAPEPFSFNEDLQTLYFKYFDMVFYYSFETKKLTTVWIDHLIDPFYSRQISALPFLFKPVDISHFGTLVEQPLSNPELKTL